VPGVAVAVAAAIAAKLFIFCSLFRGNAAGSCNKGLPPNGSIACLTCSFTSLQFMVGLNKKLKSVIGTTLHSSSVHVDYWLSVLMYIFQDPARCAFVAFLHRRSGL
jgi:hypothetical protein